MEPVVLAFILALFFQSIFSEKPKDKTPEEELGAAIAKYLNQGMKTRAEEKGKDKA